jgi:ferritin
MRQQAKEEQGHAMKICGYIEERGNRVELLPIAAPKKTWESPHAVIEQSLKHEEMVTGLINKLVDLSQEEKDHATFAFLQWFVSEQVEEEDTFRKVLDELKLVKPTCSAMLFIDRQMGKRSGD